VAQVLCSHWLPAAITCESGAWIRSGAHSEERPYKVDRKRGTAKAPLQKYSSNCVAWNAAADHHCTCVFAVPVILTPTKSLLGHCRKFPVTESSEKTSRHPIVSVDPAEKLLFSPSPAFHTMPDPGATKRPVKLTFKPAPKPSSHTHCPKPGSELKFVLPGTKPEPGA
jgi:hypothetical protein